jgi:hypothetical protein
LAVRADRIVTKTELVDDVWGGEPIGDNNLVQHMHLVRMVLGDLSKPYRYIETVHGRGYRLIVQVAGPATTNGRAANSVPPHAIAAELVSNAAFFAAMGTSASLDSSVQLCRKALELDSAFPQAHAEIAMAAIFKAAYLFGGASGQYAIARRHALEALRLDVQCARAHVAMAALAILDEHMPERAHWHIDAALELSPEQREARLLKILAYSAQGEHGAAQDAARHAMALNASSATPSAYAAFAAYLSGDVGRAAALLERLVIFKPDAAFATYLLGLVRILQGRYADARDAFERLLLGRISMATSYEKFRVRAIGGLAFVEARTGSREDACALARDMARIPVSSAVARAVARAGLRDEDSVIASVRQAREQRDPWFPFVAHDPIFSEFRGVTEFEAAVRVTPEYQL